MKILLEHNPLKPDARETAALVLAFLKKHKQEIVSETHKADFMITIGGDGTILYHKNKHPGIPIFGIGSASSFICQASKSDWQDKLRSVLSNGFYVEQRTMLDVLYKGKTISTVLNEGIISQTAPRVLFFDVRLIDNEVVAVYKFRADGFIVSTPTGSSGHTYSCFAEEIKEGSKKLVLAAVSPYRRAFLPLYVPDNYSVSVKVSLPYTAAHVVCDGMSVFSLSEGDEVVFKKSMLTQGFVVPKV